MQKIAAYLLERKGNMDMSANRKAEADRLTGVLHEWLKSKQATATGEHSGTFKSQSHNTEATFTWEHARDDDRSWCLLHLRETILQQKIFDTDISVTNDGQSVIVYASLSAGLPSSAVVPVTFDPRCPRFIRTMLDMDGPWYHGATKLQPIVHLSGIEAGVKLAEIIRSQDRTLPIIAISEDEDELIFPGLPERLAYDLAGLANVVILDSSASWGLTSAVEKSHSCYSGAVRLYWPHFSTDESPQRHPLWTAAGLLAGHSKLERITEKLIATLRRRVMAVSALSVRRPRVIDAIRATSERRHLEELKTKISSDEEYYEIANSYATENSALRLETAELAEQIASLKTELDNTKAQLRVGGKEPEDDLLPEPAREDDDDQPRRGEVRFYKKTHSTGPHDVMVHIADCGHNTWQTANKADKAKKGIARLEGSREWKNIWHCGSCTGGGVWKIKW